MAFTVTWYQPNGTSHVLSGQATTDVLWGMRRYGLAPVRSIEERVPERSGARLRSLLFDAREVELPLRLVSASESALWAQERTLEQWFDPTAGNGTLRVQSPDGVTRELLCRYQEGLERDSGLRAAGPGWRLVLVVLRAVEPFWRATADTTVNYALDAAPVTFFPFFPLRVSNSTLFNAPTIANPGDVAAEPVWTITGPGSSIALRNLTTDKLLSSARALLAGETLTIDTRFGVKTVVWNNGVNDANDYANLSSDSEFWSLAAGSNSLWLEMSGTTADSLIALAYRPLYLGA